MSEAERKRSSLREQLSRAKGALAHTLGISTTARANKRAAAESKQRLSDVLWNDRTLAASHTTAALAPNGPTPQPAAPFAGGPAQQLTSPAANPGSARARVGTPTPTSTSKPPPVPAGAFAPPRQRRPSPPQPSAATPEEPVDAILLDDLEFLIAADERATSPVSPPRTQPPAPPPARKPPPAPAKPSPAPQPSAASATIKPAPVAAASSEVVVSARVAPAVAEEEEDDDSVCQEPICTRSMARLLAGQGHKDRALAIYDVLLRQNAADASLRAEADALRGVS